MSDLESTATDNLINCGLDTERIILEVEKRPALYNKKLKEYSDRTKKEKLWGEVCWNVIHNEIHVDTKQSCDYLIAVRSPLNYTATTTFQSWRQEIASARLALYKLIKIQRFWRLSSPSA